MYPLELILSTSEQQRSLPPFAFAKVPEIILLVIEFQIMKSVLVLGLFCLALVACQDVPPEFPGKFKTTNYVAPPDDILRKFEDDALHGLPIIPVIPKLPEAPAEAEPDLMNMPTEPPIDHINFEDGKHMLCSVVCCLCFLACCSARLYCCPGHISILFS